MNFYHIDSIEDVPESECNDNVNSAMTDAEKNRASILRNLTVSSELNKILLAFACVGQNTKEAFHSQFTLKYEVII